MMGPYREPASAVPPATEDKLSLFRVNLVYAKDTPHMHSHWVAEVHAGDRLEALEKAIGKAGITRHSVWGWDVIEMEDE